MRIEKLSLKNFRGFEALEIAFPEGESGLAVFIGENGSGKSSILEVVTYLFINHFGRILQSSKFNYKSESKKDENKNIRVGKNKSINSLSISREGNIISLNNYEIERNEGTLDKSINPESRLPLNTKEDQVPLVIFYNANRIIDNSPSLKPKNLNHLTIEDALQLEVDKKLDFNTFFEWYRNTEDYENEERLTQNINYRHKGLEAIRKAIQTFLPNITPPRVSRQPYMELVFEKAGLILSISQLSYGEKLIFAMIGDIISRISIANPKLKNPLLGKGVVLIDEIEQHLHPSWQRTIIPNLRKTFPNIQFIVTTHSPQVLSNVPRENVFILEDFKLVEKTPHTLGKDTNSILYDLFGVKARPEDARKEFNQLYRLLDDPEAEALAKSMLNELEVKYGKNDPDLMEAKLNFEFMTR